MSNLINKKGLRVDGRKLDEIRPVTISVGNVKNADGSSYIEFGKNKIIAAVYGPKEPVFKWMAVANSGILRCRYHMVPYSVEERKNPNPSRREQEISKVIREALTPAVVLKDYPRTCIDIFIEVLQSDGGSRCAAINAASVALADAGISMFDMVGACAAGKIDGKIGLDMSDEEDKEGEADLPIAFMPNLDKITLLQLDGKLSEDEFTEAVHMGVSGSKTLYELQKKALMSKYFEKPVGGKKV